MTVHRDCRAILLLLPLSMSLATWGCAQQRFAQPRRQPPHALAINVPPPPEIALASEWTPPGGAYAGMFAAAEAPPPSRTSRELIPPAPITEGSEIAPVAGERRQPLASPPLAPPASAPLPAPMTRPHPSPPHSPQPSHTFAQTPQPPPATNVSPSQIVPCHQDCLDWRRDSQSQVARLQGRIDGLERQLAENQTLLRSVQMELSQSRDAMQRLTLEVERGRSEILRLEQQMASQQRADLSALDDLSAVVQRLLQESSLAEQP